MKFITNFLNKLKIKGSQSNFSRIEKEINKGNDNKAYDILKDFEISSSISVTEQIKLNIFKSKINSNLGEREKGHSFADKAINISKQLNNNILLTEALVAKASVYFDQNNFDECHKLINECISILPSFSSQNKEEINEIMAKVHYLNGRVLRRKRDVKNSLEEHKKALDLRIRSNNFAGKAEIQSELAMISFMLGDAENSINYFLESIKNYEAIGNKPKVLRVYNNAGLIFQSVGDLQKAMELYTKALKISSELNLKESMGPIYINIGNIQANLGEINKALGSLERGLAIFKEENMEAEQANALNNIATIHELKGNLQQALDLYTQSLHISEKVEDTATFAINLNNIGNIHKLRGDLDPALENFKKSLEIFEKFGDEATIESVTVLLNIIQTSILKGELMESEMFLKKVDEIKENAKNPVVDQIYRLSRAHYLKTSRRIIKKAEAQLLFQQISEEDVLVHETTVEAMFNLCEMLIQELRQSGNEIIISEVKEVLQKLTKIAEDQNSFKVQVESKLLQSKVALLELDLTLAQESLNEAQKIAFEKGLDNLALVVSGEYDALLSQLSKWTDLIDSNVSMIERLEMADLENMVTKMVRKRTDEAPDELLNETPELFILLNDQGMRTYSKVFLEDTTLDDQVVGDLLTAVNAFLQETFSTEGSIDRLKHKEHTVMLKPIDNYLCCYVFKGQSYSALQKLELFIDKLRNAKEIYKEVLSSTEEVTNEEFTNLVENVFLSDMVTQGS